VNSFSLPWFGFSRRAPSVLYGSNHTKPARPLGDDHLDVYGKLVLECFTMSILNTGSKNRAFRQPDEQCAMSDNLIASLWCEPTESGEPRFNFKLARVNSKDRNKTLSTLTIDSLMELPEAAGNLALLLSDAPGLSRDRQHSLRHLGNALLAAAKVAESNGLDEEARPAAPGGILKRLAV
jgi:hypothetical protein